MAEARVFRYDVPVDDEWHGFNLTGEVLHVGARRLDVVEFWALAIDALGLEPRRRLFRVYGTGQPAEGTYVGTAVHPALVWHLFEATGRG